MNFKDLYLDSSQDINKLITKKYSTSFSTAIILIDKSIRKDIYNIYGFVRVPDELVDSLRPEDCKKQLIDYTNQTYSAMHYGVSSNPIIHAFVSTAKKYSISKKLIQPFFDSMLTDISKKKYTNKEYQQYIYGSAEVVGLMCLCVFTGGSSKQYKLLQPGAIALGSAFQKINFLRDIKSDNNNLNRVYFPNTKLNHLSKIEKKNIERDIVRDMKLAKQMINSLDKSSRYGVNLAYSYYSALLDKITKSTPEELLTKRIRVNNIHKAFLFIGCAIQRLLQM